MRRLVHKTYTKREAFFYSSKGPHTISTGQVISSNTCTNSLHCFSKLYEYGRLPDEWKTAVVGPLHKSGDHGDVTNPDQDDKLGSLVKVHY